MVLIMTIPPKKNKLIVDNKGVTYRDVNYDYPIKIGKLKEFKGFQDVSLQITREGKFFYVLFIDPYKGMIAKGRLKRLDAVHVIRSLLHRVGYSDSDDIPYSRFQELFRNMEYIYVGE
jgi:hypothetical protein